MDRKKYKLRNIQAVDVVSYRKIHFVGIKGVGMASLAIYLSQKGIIVTGSDTSEIFPTDEELKNFNIPISIGFQEKHIIEQRPDLVIYTGAHQGHNNIEVEKARSLGIPVLPHGKALGLVMVSKRQISVAGSHGKTTTAAMIATIMSQAKKDPSYAIGCGMIFNLGNSGKAGSGEDFIAESDEYVTEPKYDVTPRFLWQNPEILVVTNIDYDHPDVYRNLSSVQSAFRALQNQQVGQKLTIVNLDDPSSEVLLNNSKNTTITYGMSRQADYQIDKVDYKQGKTQFAIINKQKEIHFITLSVPGLHNVYNAVASVAACRARGVDWDSIDKGISAFRGTRRRFEKLGEIDGVIIYDDYAHHPKEITATLSAARLWYPNNRIIVIFQPHTYSRTKALLTDFAKCFLDSDVVLISDIYTSSRESVQPGVDSMLLTKEIKKYHQDVYYTKDYQSVFSFLKSKVQLGDVIIFMGAGNIYTWGRKFLKI